MSCACQTCGACPISRSTLVGGIVGATITNAQAREIVRQAWTAEHKRSPSESELNYTQAIALFETGYGRIGQFARLAAEGKFNWGALQRRRNADGSCPPNTEPGSDAGNARCFLVFPSDVAAAQRFVWELTKNPNFANRTSATLRAMGNGTPEDVATAMKIPAAWYETSVANYTAAIRNGLRNIQATVPVGRPSAPTVQASASLAPVVLAGAMGYLGWRLYSAYGKKR